jgi:hypothetical protein
MLRHTSVAGLAKAPKKAVSTTMHQKFVELINTRWKHVTIMVA